MSTRAQKENKLFKNTLWYSIGTLSSKIITFLLVPFYTSILSTAEYGISDIISTTVSLAFPFFSLLISSAVFRFALDKQKNETQLFSFGLRVIMIGFVPLIALSFIAFSIVESIKPYWLLFIGIFIFTSLSTLESEFLKGQEKVKIVTIVDVTHTIFLVVSNIVFLKIFGMHIEGYLLSFVVSFFVSTVLYFFLGKIYKNINFFARDKIIEKEMIKYSLPLIPNSAMWWITNSSDRYFVTFLVSASASGILSISYKIPSMLSIVIAVFHSAWELSVVDDFDNENGEKFFNDVYSKYIAGLTIVASLLIVTSKLLGHFLYSSSFFEAWRFSALLIVGFAFHSLGGFLGSVFTASKKTKLLFVSTLIGAIVNIVLNFVLILLIGALGAVIATVASYIITFLIRRIGANKIITIKGQEIKKVITLSLIVIESILVYFNFTTGFILSGCIFILVCLINYDFFLSFFRKIETNLKKKRGMNI